MKRYFVCKNTFEPTQILSYKPINSILDWNIFSIESDVASALPGSAVELSKDEAIFGMNSWGDIRSTIKISADSASEEGEFDGMSYEATSSNAKMAIPMSEKRYKLVMSVMKAVAKVIIEDTFNTRFLTLDKGVSDLEKKNWEFLLADIEGGTDYVLSDLAEAKSMTPQKLTELVVAKKAQYDQASRDLFVSMNAIKQEFYRCSTIRQLNRLYEDRMGIPMPFLQAKDEGRMDETTNTRLPVRPGLRF